MSALKKVKRIGKRASKFKFTCIVQAVLVELNTKRWSPHDISISWSRRSRKCSSEYRPWEASVTNNLRGQIVWPEEHPLDFTVTLYKTAKATHFESKEWEFVAVDKDRNGKKKVLAKASVNMSQYTDLAVDTRVTLDLKPVSKKIGSVALDISLVAEFIKEGKATDEDMASLSSARSFSGISDDFDDLEDDGSDHMGSREDLGHSFDSPRPPSPYIPLPSEVVPEQVQLWAESVTKEYRNVKLLNMNTSWRNGLGFLAIIHHFKPDLVDYNSLSPLNIRDNNILVKELCRSLGIPCPIKPDHMDSTTIPKTDMIAGFVYQLFVHLDNGMPQTLPPPPPPPPSQPAVQNGSVYCSVRYELTPPGVRRQYSPQISKANSPPRQSILFRKCGSLKESPPSSEKNNSTKETVPSDQSAKQSSRQLNPSPDELIIQEYTASPTFSKHQPRMYGNADNEMDSSDEEDIVVKISDVPFAPKEVPNSKEQLQIGEEPTGRAGEDSTEDVAAVLKCLHSEKDVLSDGTESSGVGSPPDGKVSLSDIKLTEDVQNDSKLANIDEDKEIERPSSETVVTSPKRSLPSLPVDKKRKLPTAPSPSDRNRSMSVTVLSMTQTQGEPVRRMSGSSSRDNHAPPPRPKKERSKGSVGAVLLEEFENLPLRRLPQPRRVSASEELFERPATAELPRSEAEQKPIALQNKVGSVDLLSEPSPPTSSRRRRQHGGSQQLTAKNLSNVTPSLSALNVASQPPKVSSEHSLLEELEKAQQGEECLEDLTVKKGSLTRGLLKGIEEDLHRDQLSPPIAEEDELDIPLQEEEISKEEERKLLTKVEYHQQRLDEITKEIEKANMEGEMLQIDLNNARNRADKARMKEVTDQFLDLLKKKNELIKHKTEIYIMHEEEEIERREYEVKRELKKSEGIEDYQKTREQKKREDELLQELMELVNARDKLEQRKLAHEVMGETDAESLVQMEEELPGVIMGNPNPRQQTKDCVIM